MSHTELTTTKAPEPLGAEERPGRNAQSPSPGKGPSLPLPGPSDQSSRPPNNAAPSDRAANSQRRTSKLTTTFGGWGPCLVPFSPCADSQARTYQLLLFHGEQSSQGPPRRLEARVKFRWVFAGEWRGHKGRNRWGRGGHRGGGLGQRGQETKGQEKGAAFSSEEESLHLPQYFTHTLGQEGRITRFRRWLQVSPTPLPPRLHAGSPHPSACLSRPLLSPLV